MAAATSLAIAGLGMSAIQIGKGISDTNKAKNALDNLEVPDLDNAFEDIQISTIGSDLMREENARTSASAIDSVKSGGVRSVMGSIPQLAAFNNDANKEARAYLDKQVQDRSYAIAQDDTRIRQMEEQRYQGEVQGLGQAMNVGKQNAWNGMRGAFQTIGYGLDNGAFTKGEDGKLK